MWGLTTQNEPMDGNIYKFPFQAMGWTAEMQRDFVKMDLGPALHNNSLQHVALMILDDQRLMLPYWAKIVSFFFVCVCVLLLKRAYDLNTCIYLLIM